MNPRWTAMLNPLRGSTEARILGPQEEKRCSSDCDKPSKDAVICLTLALTRDAT